MIREAMQWIQERAEAAHTIKPVNIPGLPARMFAYQESGKLLTRDIEDANRVDSVRTIEDLCTVVVAAWKPAIDRKLVEIYVGETGVVAILAGRGQNADVVGMGFETARGWEKLVELENDREPLAQTTLVRTLVTDMAGLFPDSVVNRFRTLAISKSVNAGAEIDTSKRNVSRAVNEQIVGGGEALPREVVATAYVYDEFGVHEDDSGAIVSDGAMMQKVACHVEYDFEEGGIVLIPVPQHLVLGRQRTLREVQRRISALLTDVPHVCVLGNP